MAVFSTNDKDVSLPQNIYLIIFDDRRENIIVHREMPTRENGFQVPKITAPHEHYPTTQTNPVAALFHILNLIGNFDQNMVTPECFKKIFSQIREGNNYNAYSDKLTKFEDVYYKCQNPNMMFRLSNSEIFYEWMNIKKITSQLASKEEHTKDLFLLDDGLIAALNNYMHIVSKNDNELTSTDNSIKKLKALNY